MKWLVKTKKEGEKKNDWTYKWKWIWKYNKRKLHYRFVFETVSENYKDKLKFYKVNIDENPKLTEKLSIMHVPTLVILKNGEVVNRVSGFMDERELANFIDKSL